MGALCKLVDAMLFVFFFVIAVAAPLIDAQLCLPSDLYPKALVDLKQWYSREFGDFLVLEKPRFFVSLVWFELLFQWPLSVASIYAILTRKSWFGTTCLIYGASLLTSMAAIMGEIMGSGRRSDKLLSVYAPFAAFGFLAILRGVIPVKSFVSAGTRPLPRKKRA